MAEKPIKENDLYINIQEDKYHQNKRKLLQTQNITGRNKLRETLNPLSFRFKDRPEDRINKMLEEAKFLDTVPNPEVNYTFNKIIRLRNKEKELNGCFKFKPNNSIERIVDNASTYYIQQDQLNLQQMKELVYKGQPNQLNTERSRQVNKSIDMRNSIQGSNMSNTTTQFITPRRILPSLHQKTHFKAATTFLMNTHAAGVLNFNEGDKQIENILQDINSIGVRKGITTTQRYDQQTEYIEKQAKQQTRKNLNLKYLNKSMEIYGRNRPYNLQSSKEKLSLHEELGLDQSFDHSRQAKKGNLFKEGTIAQDARYLDSLIDDSLLEIQEEDSSQRYQSNKKSNQNQHRRDRENSVSSDIDFNQINIITKNVLKNCNVIRKKNLNTFSNSKELLQEYSVYSKS
eukprot:403352583